MFPGSPAGKGRRMVRTMPPYKCTRKARQSDVSTNPNQSLPIRPESIAHSEQGTRVAADSNKHTEPSFRLDLNLRQGCLDYFNRGPADRTFQTESLQGQIDLKSLLSLKDRRWNRETRCALAVLLAYTLLYLYGGPISRVFGSGKTLVFFTTGIASHSDHFSELLWPMMRSGAEATLRLRILNTGTQIYSCSGSCSSRYIWARGWNPSSRWTATSQM